MIIKTAIIGFGLSGSKFHAPFLKIMPGFDVTHVVSTRYSEVKAIFPEAIVLNYSEINTVLERKDIDLIIVTTPNSEHYEVTKKSLQNGKHVVVEKPFVLNVSEGAELIKLADIYDRVLTVYHNRRWDSDFLTIKKILESGALGQIASFTARFDRYRPIPRIDRWKESAVPGSGILWDLGAHLIDQALKLFGIPQSLLADIGIQRSAAQAVDYFNIIFSYDDGMRLNLTSSSICFSPACKYEIHGTNGSFIKSGTDPQEQFLMNGRSPIDKDFGIESEKFYGKMTLNQGDLKEKMIISERGCYQEFFKSLQSAIEKTGSVPVKPEEALDVIKIIRLCEMSHEKNAWMTVL